jgi:hypothetical protein
VIVETSTTVTVPIVGALGTPPGVVTALGKLGIPAPRALVAYTLNVYPIPAVNPLTVIVPDPAWLSVPVIPPGLLTAV